MILRRHPTGIICRNSESRPGASGWVLVLAIVLGFGCASAPKPKSGRAPEPWENPSAEPAPVQTGVSILQGATSSRATRITVLTPRQERWSYVVTDLKSNRRIPLTSRTLASRAFSPWALENLSIEQLPAGGKFRLDVLDSTNRVLDSREFHTLKGAGAKSIRAALVSCMDDFFWPLEKRMWGQLFGDHPDVLFLMGDNVYVDWKGGVHEPNVQAITPEKIWNRYIDVRRSLSLYFQPELIPTYSSWDDHDFGFDNSEATFPQRVEATQVFKTFFPIQSTAPEWTHFDGSNGALEFGGITFMLLDNRSWRSEDRKGPIDTHWGAEQEARLANLLSAPTGKPLVLINGDQFLGGYHKYESLEGDHPGAFRRFVEFMRKATRPTLLVSGDRHLFELQEVEPALFGFKTYEITTSAIHAKVFPAETTGLSNPRRIEQFEGEFNFAVVDLTPSPGKLDVDLRAFSPAGVKVRRRLEIARP